MRGLGVGMLRGNGSFSHFNVNCVLRRMGDSFLAAFHVMSYIICSICRGFCY